MAKGNAPDGDKRKTPHATERLSNGGDTTFLTLTFLDLHLDGDAHYQYAVFLPTLANWTK
jgi:hypothetical protein